MTNITAFNSGRYYGPNGQRIAFAVVADRLIFTDIDRRIDGSVLIDETSEITKHAMMRYYDRDGCYSHVPSEYNQVLALLKTAAKMLTADGGHTIKIAAKKGEYVRMSTNDDDMGDCGVVCLCRVCAESGSESGDGKFVYLPWEDDISGDIGTCRECGCIVY